jgi:serine protease Do
MNKLQTQIFPFFIALILMLSCVTASARTRSLSGLYQNISESVVMIQTVERGLDVEKPGEAVTTGGLGSGVIISEGGLIMTAAHVVEVADRVVVVFKNGKKAPAKVLGLVKMSDVALIKLDKVPQNLAPAKLGNSDAVKIGDRIFIVGAPYGLEQSLSAGYISGRRKMGDMSEQLIPIEFLQTDAAINRGNSGGPMFNMDGEVVGIVSFILSQSGGFDGMGFAASINVAKELLLKEKSHWIGMDAVLLSTELAEILNVPQAGGFLVQRVAKNSPAEHLGVRPGKTHAKIGNDELVLGGDIILEIEGRKVTPNMEDIKKIWDFISNKPGLKGVTFKVLRAGKTVKLRIPK